VVSHQATILRFLRKHGTHWFDDDDLAAKLAIRPRQTVNQVCRSLHEAGLIDRLRKNGKIVNTIRPSKMERMGEGGSERPIVSQVARRELSPALSFEEMARKVVEERFRVQLQRGSIPGVPKLFDFVSTDHSVVGDAKFYTMVQGEYPPPAKLSIISEHVWLLQSCAATHRVLVFGNDPRVPQEWLKRYGHLAKGVQFFFLAEGGRLVPLTTPAGSPVASPLAKWTRK
jgi:hypothetical protein